MSVGAWGRWHREMGYIDTAGQVSPCSCHSRQALCPLKMDHLCHLQTTVPSWGAGDSPPRRTAASFPPAGLGRLLRCPSSSPHHAWCWSVSTVSRHRGRVGRAVLTVRKGVLAIVQAPFPGRRAPAAGDSPQTTLLLGKSVENGSVLGSQNVAAR